jgi:hypothetical protein
VTQKEHLLRQIEELGILLERTRWLIFGGELGQAIAELKVVSAQVGVDIELLGVLAPESLLQNLIGPTGGTLEKLLPAAEMLYLKGELEEVKGDMTRSRQSFSKAALLARQIRVLVADQTDLDLRIRVGQLLNEIENRSG